MNTDKIFGPKQSSEESINLERGEKEEQASGLDGYEAKEIIAAETTGLEAGNINGQDIKGDEGITHLLLDNFTIASGLNNIATSANKYLSDGEGGVIPVPDYNTRFKALVEELKLKGAYKQKEEDNKKQMKAIYVLK